MSDDQKSAARIEQEMREHERQARERQDGSEGDGPLDDELGTPDSDAMPAPPGNIQGGSLGGAS